MGKVPALKDGDATLGEAAAICAYVADRYPETKLAPAAHRSPAREISAVAVLLAELHRAGDLIQLFTKLEVPPSTAAWGSATQVFDVLDAALQKGPWILGEKFSAADIMHRLGAEFRGAAVQDGAAAAVVRRLYRPLHGASGVPARGEDRGGVKRALAQSLASKRPCT